MKTRTLAVVGLLMIGLMAVVPSASAATSAMDDDQGRCIGIYEEDAQGNKKCTGVWQDTLCDLLLNLVCAGGSS